MARYHVPGGLSLESVASGRPIAKVALEGRHIIRRQDDLERVERGVGVERPVAHAARRAKTGGTYRGRDAIIPVAVVIGEEIG